MNLKISLAFIVVLFCGNTYSNGANIGYGTIKGIKVYNNVSQPVTKIYLNDDATRKDIESCAGEASITHSKYTDKPQAMNQMISIALAAYMGGKKVRLWASDTGTCEADFIAAQESYF